MLQALILSNFVTLMVGLYFSNDIFIRYSTGALLSLTLLAFMESKNAGR